MFLLEECTLTKGPTALQKGIRLYEDPTGGVIEWIAIAAIAAQGLGQPFYYSAHWTERLGTMGSSYSPNDAWTKLTYGSNKLEYAIKAPQTRRCARSVPTGTPNPGWRCLEQKGDDSWEPLMKKGPFFLFTLHENPRRLDFWNNGGAKRFTLHQEPPEQLIRDEPPDKYDQICTIHEPLSTRAFITTLFLEQPL